MVVITHMHPDHIGGLMADGAPTYPNARYVTGEIEYDFWSKEERLSGPDRRRRQAGPGERRAARRDRITFLKDEGEVVPGHPRPCAPSATRPATWPTTSRATGRRLLLWGDTANHYVMSVQRPDWHVRFDMDKEAAAATRKRIFDLAAADRIPVTGYHMPFPAVGYIDRTGQRVPLGAGELSAARLREGRRLAAKARNGPPLSSPLAGAARLPRRAAMLGGRTCRPICGSRAGMARDGVQPARQRAGERDRCSA